MKIRLKYILPFIVLSIFLTINGFAQVTKDSLISTTGTFKVPTGVTQLSVQCWGGGGRGSRVTTNGGFAGGGGGGGAYAKKLVTVAAGNTYNVVIGAGSTSTGAGGNSYFNAFSAAWVGAIGGNSCANNATTGASGGAAASSFGDVTRSGGNGANANYGSLYGGGGGSSAGTGSNGANGSGANGGTAPSGGGNGGNGRSGTQGVGIAGSAPGGGGGGALSTSNNDYNPGNGANGQVIISWCVPVSLTGTSATEICGGSSSTTVTLTGSAASLPTGTYTVTYSISDPASSGLTATMTVSTAGSGTFTATGFTSVGTQTITITKLESDWCSWTISANNTANVIVNPEFSLTSVSATPTCPTDGSTTITATGNASNLPVGSYTVTYNRSNPAATGLTATMTVATAGSGTFSASGFTSSGSPTLTITNLEKGSCSNIVSSNNVATVNVKVFALTSCTATNIDNCNNISTVTLNGNAVDLPTGTYTVTYNRSSPAATGLTSTMTVSVAGTGTFSASGFTDAGVQTVTITKLEKGSCSNNITSNNVASLTVTLSELYALTGTSATPTCPAFGETTVTLSSTAVSLPAGSYTVTYDRSNPAATGLTATMTVSPAGTGTFTATGFTNAGSPTITITKIDNGTCLSNISSNNVATVVVGDFSLTSTTATNSCDETSTVTLTSSAAGLPVGSYTVTYSRSTPAGINLTAVMEVTVAGTGTFTAVGFNSAGNSTITITNLASGGCSNAISANNSKTISVSTYRLTSITATNSCDETSSVTISHSTPARLPVGTYTITYNISSPALNGQTATMEVTTAGTGTFIAQGFTVAGNSTIAISGISNGTCWSNVLGLANTTKLITVSTFALTGTTAQSTCTTSGQSTVSVTGSAARLPVGSYTVTYNRSDPAATGLTATMDVTVAGSGSFVASGFTNAGSPTITITKLESGSCHSAITSNNTATVVVASNYSLTSVSATNVCASDGNSTVTASGNASNLPIGSYTVTYNRSNPAATGLTATMTVAVAGTGTFTAAGYTTSGNQSVTITKIEKGSCSSDISSNNVANFTVTSYSISSLSATNTCAASGSTTVSITTSASDLPTGTYTVTYSRSAPAASGLTATMTVSTAGSGSFTATGFTTNGEQTITVTNLQLGTCSKAITANNSATVKVLYYFTSAEASSVCTDDGTTNVKLYSSAEGLPIGSYTVTYSISNPASSGLTAVMVVDVAGYGQFGVGGLTTAGNQTITITKLNMGSCNSTLSANNTIPVLVSSSAPAQPSAISGLTYSCSGQSQTYSVTNVAGVTYYWQFPSQWTITSGEYTNSITCTVGDAGGIIRVTPFNGCTGTSRSLTITQISPSIAITNLSSPCGKDGAVAVTASGGSGDYSYAWSTGETTSSISNLYKGTYNVTITDNVTGCSKTFVNVVGTTFYNNICSTKEGTVTTSGILNSYYAPAASGTVAIGSTSVTLGAVHASGNTTNFSSGDLALFIQMQGATMDTTNTPAWGTLSNVIAGKYEYVYVSSFNSGTGVLNLSTGLVNSYKQDRANGYTFQVIRVPQYFNLTLNGNLSILKWRGNSVGDPAVGGVIAIDVANNLNFNGQTIDANGAGFRGGAGYNYASGSGLGKNTDYSFYSASNGHNYKGEGIAGSPKFVWDGSSHVQTGVDYPHAKGKGRGAPGNAGGSGNDADVSGNDENAGGGGGGNVTSGGMGGCPWRSTNFVKDIGGRGGRAFSGSATRIIMGGGGGGGAANNSSDATAPKGGNGGGIVIIHAKSFSGTGTISVNGSTGTPGAGNNTNDAGGGGGAGGTILLTFESSTATLTLNANGGRGSDAELDGAPPANSHGPGGGGSGGAIYTNASFSSPNITYNINGGANGLTTTNNIPYESKPGDNGVYRCTVPPDDLPTTFFARTCMKDGVAPTISCPSVSTCCAGNVPAIYGNLGEYTAAGGSSSDNLSGIACLAYDSETGSEASGSINRLYSIVDSAGNRSSCTHQITVKPTPNAGISGTTSVFRNDPQPLVTFTNTTNYNATVTYSVNTIGKAIHTINVPANSTADLSVPTNNEGVYEYKLIDVFYQIVPSCSKTFDPPTAPSATITVLGALPVEIIYLDATRESNYVNVKWATATEVNNDFFVIQRSQDGVSFKNIDTVDGAGNSNILLSYSYKDRNPLSGISYYRLKQVDFDGVYSLTHSVSVKENSEENQVSIYPNPVKRGEFIHVVTDNNIPNSKVSIFLKDNNSNIIESFGTLTDSNGNLFFKLPIEDNLKTGVYFIEISCEGKYLATKIVVGK